MKYSRWAEGEKISLGRRRAKPVLIRMRIFHSTRITRIAYNNLVVILKNVIKRHFLFILLCYPNYIQVLCQGYLSNHSRSRKPQMVFPQPVCYTRVICLNLRGFENLEGFSPSENLMSFQKPHFINIFKFFLIYLWSRTTQGLP